VTARGAVLAVLVLLASCPVSARDVRIGLEGGMTWAIQDFDCRGPYEYDTEVRRGFRFGLFGEYDVHPHFCIDAGLNYVTTGMEYDWMFYDVENRVSYLSIPVALRARMVPRGEVEEGDVTSPYVFAGPRVDFLLDKNVDPWFEAIYEDFATVGFGADVGVGLEVVSARLEYRYSLDFTDACPDDPVYKITNRVQSVVLRFVIPAALEE